MKTKNFCTAFLFIASVINGAVGWAQPFTCQDEWMCQLDSISRSNSSSSHFASLYLTTAQKMGEHLDKNQLPQAPLLSRFELAFAKMFLQADSAYSSGGKVPAPWSDYYAPKNLTHIQYMLTGANIHLNSDLWQALVTAFTRDELKQFKPLYISCIKPLQRVYFSVYQKVWHQHSKLRRLHLFTLGLDKKYGSLLLKRWRIRQFRMAELYYASPQKFARRHKKTVRQLHRINRFILMQL